MELLGNIIAYFAMFFAMLFLVNFIFSMRTLAMDNNKAKYYSKDTASPILSLVVLPLIAVAIIVAEFIAADNLGLGPGYVILAMVICLIIVVIVHKALSRSGAVRTMASSERDFRMKQDKYSFSGYLYNCCSLELDRIRKEGSFRIGDLTEGESSALIERYMSTPKRNVGLVGINYLDREGSFREKAFESAVKASDEGDAYQTYLVALMYGRGIGTDADTVKCIVYMNRAALAGHIQAKNIMDQCRFMYPHEVKNSLR